MNNKFDRFRINNFINKNIHIVAAMPSVGKSTYSEKSLANPNSTIKAIDLESSDYKWNIENGEKALNPDFPNNYIESILWIPELSPEVNVVFVACHSEVRLLLDEIGLDYTIVVPSLDRKDELLRKCRERGNDETFIKKYDENYECWISKLKDTKERHRVIELGRYQFINESFMNKYFFQR